MIYSYSTPRKSSRLFSQSPPHRSVQPSASDSPIAKKSARLFAISPPKVSEQTPKIKSGDSESSILNSSPTVPPNTKHGEDTKESSAKPQKRSIPETLPEKSTKRAKGSAAVRSARYLHQDYVSTLLLSDRLKDYDNGAKPSCHSKCSCGCQQHFLNMEGGPKFLRDQLEKWWGANATKEWRDSELAHEILSPRPNESAAS